MKIEKLLTFDIWGEYAHFKKYYTTTSPLTFSIPPKTTLYGIFGAILGLKKEDYLNYFAPGTCKIGIQIINPIKKTRINLNLIDTKKAKLMSRIDSRTQIKTEFLKDVKYRIYFSHQDEEIYNNLKKKLKEHKTTYSISLGLSETLANFKYNREYKTKLVKSNDKWLDIPTVIRIDKNNLKNNIDFTQTDKEYFSDKIALEMKSDREVVDYGQVIYERNGKAIRTCPNQYYKLENGINCLLL